MDRSPDSLSELGRARELYAARVWRDAVDLLARLDQQSPLELADLWRLAFAAALCGSETESSAAFERIYHAQIDTQPQDAFQAAFWLGFRLIHTPEHSRGKGWLVRAERCAARLPQPCVESGYLAIPQVREHFLAGRYAEALELATRAAELGSSLGDHDLGAFARNLQARVLLRQGARDAGLELLDEVMLAVTAGELAPNITGLIYCSAIESCQAVFALDRMREWTESLRGWCDAQPQLRAFSGACMVSRAEVLELAGNWSEALEEARRAAKDLSEAFGARAAGEALYREAEIHRLRGELAAAEARYGDASHSGRDPQPGLALLRLAQGRTDAAVQGLRRALAAATLPLARVKLLPAQVESLLAAGLVEDARGAVGELEGIAETFGAEALIAVAARARGTLELAGG